MVKTDRIELNTGEDTCIIDITSDVQNSVSSSGLKDGTATVFVPGATGAITTVEYESGLIADLDELFEKIAPQAKAYKHNEAWHDGNGHAHVRASMIGPSLTVPFSNKQLLLGTWQQIIFLDFDPPPRRREIILQILGE